MAKYPDHPFIKQVRRAYDIPEDADFVRAIAPRFVSRRADERKSDLEAFDAAQKHDTGLRSESQLASVRRDLRNIDEGIRRASKQGLLKD